MPDTRVCPECGAEYLPHVRTCADCLVALEDPIEDEVRVEEVVDEVVFDLVDWTDELRGKLAAELQRRGIEFDWEEDGIAVDDDVADTVEEIVDAIEDEAGIGDVDASDDIPQPDDGYDESVMEAVGTLFVAADRLMHDPDDGRFANDLLTAVAAIAPGRPPFGIGARDWERIVALAASTRDAIEADADDEVIAREARALRDLLRGYV